MKIALTVGHSILKNGNITSASGVINEYKYNKELAPIIAKYLKQLGYDVDVIICPERTFSKSGEEKNYKLNIINNGKYDLVMELHLNAFVTSSVKGTEVLYVTKGGKVYADRIQAKLKTLFSSRGVKHRSNLYMLTKTKPVSIMLETFFCTNQTDCNIGKDKDKVARLIAEGVANKNIPKPIVKKEVADGSIYRVQVGAYGVKSNAEAMAKKLEKLGFDVIITK